MYAPPAAPPPPVSKGWPVWLIVLAALGAFFFVLMPILSVLAVYGVRKYLANAKNAEARSTLGQIARDASLAYERNHDLCASASHPVPSSLEMIRGSKYQSAPGDWEVDRARNAGFACFGFSLAEPQYYQYSYVVSRTGEFRATAHGDLNGDGKVSTFTVRGRASGGTVAIEPRIEETDPEE
jgi:hypothetical protein